MHFQQAVTPLWLKDLNAFDRLYTAILVSGAERSPAAAESIPLSFNTFHASSNNFSAAPCQTLLKRLHYMELFYFCLFVSYAIFRILIDFYMKDVLGSVFAAIIMHNTFLNRSSEVIFTI